VLWLSIAFLDIASAQSARTVPANPDSALQSILGALEGSPLALSDAVAHALGNSTAVLTAEAASAAARGASRREAGRFDPEVFFTFDHLVRDEPTASFFSGASVLSTRQDIATGGVRMELPIGTSIRASLDAFRLETNSAFASLNPQYTSLGHLSLRQPLLGGFTTSARKEAEKADRESDAARARHEQMLLAVAGQVEDGYWDLYAAERDYAVQKLTRDRAEAFLREAETRMRTGLIGPNQVANARTFLAEQEILLLDREEDVDRLSDRLASVIGRRPEPGGLRFLTVDAPPRDFLVEDVDVLVQQAVEMNLALRAARSDVEAGRALSDAAFWEALPRLNLTASLGGSGLAGSARDVVFGGDTLRTTRTGSAGDAMTQALQRDFPFWSVGVELSIPIGLRTGLGEQERLEAEVLIAEQREIQYRRLLEDQVRAASRELLNGNRRLTAAREGVASAQEQVRIGVIEFQNGRTTAFELVRLGADFAVAQQRYTQALVRGAKAAANLRQLTSGAYGGGR
jgi:outer membrane protein TolC